MSPKRFTRTWEIQGCNIIARISAVALQRFGCSNQYQVMVLQLVAKKPTSMFAATWTEGRNLRCKMRPRAYGRGGTVSRTPARFMLLFRVYGCDQDDGTTTLHGGFLQNKNSDAFAAPLKRCNARLIQVLFVRLSDSNRPAEQDGGKCKDSARHARRGFAGVGLF